MASTLFVSSGRASGGAHDRALVQNNPSSRYERWLSIRPLITLVLVLLLSTIWTVIILTGRITEKSEKDRVYEGIIHEAATFAEHATRSFKSIESKVDFVAYALSQDPSPDNLKRLVERDVVSMDMLIQLAHVDRDARTVSTNIGPDPNRTPLYDREHIRVHLDGVVNGMFIGRPVKGRVSGRWSVQLTKKIRGPDGKTEGVVVGSMDPYFFQGFWKDHSFFEDIVLELIGEDGSLRSSSQKLTESLEQPLIYRNTHRSKEIAIDETDYQEKRLISVHRLEGFPLYVKASLPTSYLDGKLKEAKRPLFYVGIASTLSLGFLGLLLLNASRRLEKSSKTLEQQTIQLINMAEDARKSGDAKASFLATMSHEIRTPLHAIIGFTDVIWEKQELDRSLLSIIRSSGKHLLAVVNDILDFSEMNSGRMKLHLEAFDLRELIQEISAIAKQLSAKDNVEFRTKNVVDPLWVIGDRRRIMQCLLNLVSNSLKFTDYGHIELIVQISDPSPSSRTVSFMVHDTGIGMPESALPKVLEPFGKDYSKGTHLRGGAGLGLPITQKLVELMKGRLVMNSRLGEGTHCAIHLQLSVPVKPHPANAFNVEHATHSAEPLSILLVDDVESARYFARLILEQMGHNVSECENGAQAVHAASEHCFDVVLMDIQMPVLDGLSATRRIRELPFPHNKTKIIALTAQALDSEVESALRAGVDSVISKPFSKSTLNYSLRAADQK